MAKLVVTASRLDAEIPPVTGGRAYDGGWLEENPMIKVPIKFPTAGCWQVTGETRNLPSCDFRNAQVDW